MTGSRKKTVIAVVVIAAVVAAGLFGFFQLRNLATTGSTEIPDTFVLRKTNLESKVTASGNFASTDPVNVGSSSMGGVVDEVFVEQGDRVYAGDVLARLKTSDLERSISDTKSAISEMARGDSQKLEQAQRAFGEADDSYNATNRQTQNEVNRAQTAYNNANNAWNNQHATLESALKTAQQELDDAIAAGAAADEIEMKTKARDAAKAALDALKAALDQAGAALDAANVQRENALRQANSAWYNAKAGLDSLKGVDSAKQSRSQLDSLNEELANATIVSPITGIVTSVLTDEGQAAMSGMFLIEDTETLQIVASVAEYDIIRIEPGMAAHITSNATGSTAYDGIVDFVAPKAADAGGNFEVRVLLTSAVGQLKPGMTATVEIVTAAKNDVFAAPIDAVVTKPDGTKIVYVYEPGGLPASGGPVFVEGAEGGPVMVSGQEGSPDRLTGLPLQGGDTATGAGNRREIVVETGMETDYYIEIISSELSEGMLILSDPMGRNVSFSGGNMMMMGGPGGGQAVGAAPVRSEGSVTVVTEG